MFKFKKGWRYSLHWPCLLRWGAVPSQKNASAEASCQYRECTCRRAAGSPCAGRKRPGTVETDAVRGFQQGAGCCGEADKRG